MFIEIVKTVIYKSLVSKSIVLLQKVDTKIDLSKKFFGGTVKIRGIADRE